MSLPPEGPFFKFDPIELEFIFLQIHHTDEEIEKIEHAISLYKDNQKKDAIFSELDEFGKIRCGHYWDLYRESFLNILNEYWDQCSEGETIMCYEFTQEIYTKINDDLVRLLNGTSFELNFILRHKYKKKSEYSI